MTCVQDRDFSYLQSDKFIQQLSESISFQRLETLTLITVYRAKEIVIPEQLYSHLLVSANNQFDYKATTYTRHRLLEQSLDSLPSSLLSFTTATTTTTPSILTLQQQCESIVKSVLYLYDVKEDSIFIEIAFLLLNQFYRLSNNFIASVIQQYSHRVKQHFLDRLDLFSVCTIEALTFWTIVAPYLNKEQVRQLVQHMNIIDISVKEDFINSTPDPRETMLEVVRLFSLDFINVVTYMDLFCVESPDLLYVFLEETFKLALHALIYYRNNTPAMEYIPLLMYKIAEVKPEFIDRLVKLILPMPVTYIIQQFKKKYNSFQIYIDWECTDELQLQLKESEAINNQTNNHSPIPTLNYIILQKIIELFIFDINKVDGKEIVDLARVSKHFHKICSGFLTNYPVRNLNLSNKISHIGGKFCLFKQPPLHLRDQDIRFIPDRFIKSCLQRLESLTLYFDCDQFEDFEIPLVKAKNLKHLTIVQDSTVFFGDLETPYYQYILCSGSFKRYKSNGELREDGSADAIDELIQFDQFNYENEDGDEFSYGIDGDEKHFLRILIDHYNNDLLQSVDYITNSMGVTHYYHCLSILNQLKLERQHLRVNAELYQNNLPIHCQGLNLITKITKGSSEILFNCKDLTSLKKLVVQVDSSTNSIDPMLNLPPTLQSVTIDTNNLESTFTMIKIISTRNIPTLKLIYREPVDIVQFNTQRIYKFLNELFQELSLPKNQSIKYIKIIYNYQYYYRTNTYHLFVPLINQHSISQNIINLHQFSPTNETFFKFYRRELK